MYQVIDIHKVTKIEYFEFASMSDMHIYEIYLIAKLHPLLNSLSKSWDDPTVTLPELNFSIWDSKLFAKWKAKCHL
jgi:hypothetical protein